MSSRTEQTGVDPQTVDEARDAVVRSRERISSTIDQLEGRIVEKKHELQHRADVLRPVREQVVRRPFTAVAIGIGVGALLGSLGGSRGDDGHRSRRARHTGRSGLIDDAERHELREWRRARRDRLRARFEDDDSDDGPSRFDNIRHQLVGAVTSAIGAAITARVTQMSVRSDRSDGARSVGARSDGRDRPMR